MPLSPIREITTVEVDPLHQNQGFEFAEQFPHLGEELDLNFAGVETQHATHALHPYVAAINPPLAATMIRHYVPENETILDPFCGGGGVLLEAMLNGRNAIGCDINPLAVLLSRVKTTRIPSKRASEVFAKIISASQERAHQFNVQDIPEVVRFWYLDNSLKPLCALRESILEIKERKLRELFQVVLSATARDVMLTYRGEIRLRKLQGKDLERFKPDVWANFRKRGLAAIAKVNELPPGGEFRVELADCRELSDRHQCHTVVTSPPYGDDKNGVGYFQFSRNMLYWVGISLDEQKECKDRFLGSKTNKLGALPRSLTLQRTLDIIREKKETHFKEAASFYSDYFQGLARIITVTRERVIVIIGDRVLSRTKINNGNITTEFMSDLGWNLEHYYSRELTKKRIANLGGDGGGISLEHIMVFRR